MEWEMTAKKLLFYFTRYEMDEDDEWTDDWYFSINFSALSQISWLVVFLCWIIFDDIAWILDDLMCGNKLCCNEYKLEIYDYVVSFRGFRFIRVLLIFTIN